MLGRWSEEWGGQQFFGKRTLCTSFGHVGHSIANAFGKTFFSYSVCAVIAACTPDLSSKKGGAINILHSLRVWQLFLFLAVGDTLWAYFHWFLGFSWNPERSLTDRPWCYCGAAVAAGSLEAVFGWFLQAASAGAASLQRNFRQGAARGTGEVSFAGKITIFHGKTHYKWPFSIAMLVYQRVDGGFVNCHDCQKGTQVCWDMSGPF